ncbi:hypothetical protein D6B98_29930 [Bradyrhizobium sp. LVM 105]|nr:hypothetical protein D6B98_29930 [Bradyrhizobium sp. LVM 105]
MLYRRLIPLLELGRERGGADVVERVDERHHGCILGSYHDEQTSSQRTCPLKPQSAGIRVL